MPSLIGQTVSHYRIIERLGAGGMGEVYRAEDSKLKRTVALKFLVPSLTTDPEAKERFIHEAQAASALDHPNICNIHEIGETDDGQLFIAMACYDGQTLTRKLEQGPLTIEEAIHTSLQIAQGLTKAHEHGIVHRDIKPANIIITSDGTLKILDFGLAKLRGSAPLFKEGTTAGTAAYMSPEQIRGEEVDQCSDVFSLGVVLYELLTSRLPFRGEFDTALNYSILNEIPPPPSTLRPGIPPTLDKIIQCCLEKDNTKRYQSAKEVVAALGQIHEKMSPVYTAKKKAVTISLWLGAAVVVVAAIALLYLIWRDSPTSLVAHSIAVLPFDDMSATKDQEYFCNGMTEELISRLSNVKGLKVPARTSVSVLKGRMGIAELGEMLKVQTVLEGSVRKDNNKLRIAAQLINVADGYHIWSQTYDREVKDMFMIQDEISLAIVDALKLKLAPEEEAQMTRRTIDNVQAYELHLKARYEMWLFTEESLGRALEFSEKGLAITGDNETLYGDMGQIYFLYNDMGIRKEEGYLNRAEACIQKVFALNPESSYGHLLRANIHRRRGNAQEAVREFKRSLSRDPNNPDAMAWLAWVYMHSGKESSSAPLLGRLSEIDPFGPVCLWGAGLQDVLAGRFETGIEALGKVRQVAGDNPLFLYLQAKALAYAGHDEEAIELLTLLANEAPQTIWAMLGSFFKSALQRRNSDALQMVTQELKELAQRDELFPIWMAESYALIGEKKEAIDWLEHGINWGFINYPFLVQHDRFLANLQSEERFRSLMEQVKKQWEAFEV